MPDTRCAHPRRKSRLLEAVLLAALGLAAGCGQPGPPLPPSANLPQSSGHFTAQRLGGQVVLNWIVPTETTDGVRIHQPISANLCVWPNLLPGTLPSALQTCPHVIQAVVPALPAQLPETVTMALNRLLPPGPRGDFAGLAVEFVNRHQQGAGWSGFVSIPLTPVAPPPAGLRTTVEANGVRLSWNPPAAGNEVAVYREELDSSGKPVAAERRLAVVPAAQNSYLDDAVSWNRTYLYWVRSVAGKTTAQVESANSTLVRVTPRDVFPPAVPMALQAVLSVGARAVDLSWEPVTTPDLAGYRVYRRVPGASWQPLGTGLVLTPVYRDEQPPEGPVEYAVTAIDHAGNESQRSQAVSVTVVASP